MQHDSEMNAIPIEVIYRLAKRVDRPRAHALAILYTVLRTIHVLDYAEIAEDGMENPIISTINGGNEMKPIIGIPLDFVMDTADSKMSRGIPGQLIVATTEPSIGSFREAGAIPMGLGRAQSLEEARETLTCVDGLCVPGGPDIYPGSYGKRISRYNGDICLEKDESDIFYIQAAIELHMPFLGLCRGLQLVNCVLGGDMIEDIPRFTTSEIVHSSPVVPASLGIHPVTVEEGSFLARVLPSRTFNVNSYHHQAINTLGKGLKCVARSHEDDIIEAIENDDQSIVAVQWHPEYLKMSQPEQNLIFVEFIKKIVK